MDKDEKLWSGLSYLGLAICAIPTILILVIKKDESRIIKFHSLQALALAVLNIILGVLSMIPVVNLLTGLLWFLLLLYWVYIIIRVFTGHDEKLPVVAGVIEENLL